MAFEFERMLERVYGISAVMLFVSGACAPQTRDPEKAPISSLPDQEFIQELRKMNGTPQDLLEDPAAMECLLPIIRADCRLVEGYRFEAGSAVRCPVVALGGISDTEVSIERVRAWGDLAGGRFSYSMFEGDHFFINSARGMVLHRICMALGPMLTAVS
jgi:medium-chain acyl-[acyl-carrier-protein] hydrolase